MNLPKLGVRAAAFQVIEPFEGGLAAGGVALDGGGQLARRVDCLAGGPDAGHQAAQGELGRVEDADEAEQPER